MMRKGAPPGASPLNWKRVRNLSPRASSPRAPTECSPGMGSARRTMTRTTRSAPAPRGAARWGLGVRPRLDGRVAADARAERRVEGLSRGRRRTTRSRCSAGTSRRSASRGRPRPAARRRRGRCSRTRRSATSSSARAPSPPCRCRAPPTSAPGCRRPRFPRGRSARRPGSRARATPGGARARRRSTAPPTRPPPSRTTTASCRASPSRRRSAPAGGASSRSGRRRRRGWRRSIRRAASPPRRDGDPVRAAPHESVAARRAAAGHLFLPIATAPPLAAIMDSPRLGPLAERPPPPL